MKKLYVLILIMMLAISFRGTLNSKANSVTSEQFTVTTNVPRFQYYNDVLGKGMHLDLTITSSADIDVNYTYIASIEYVNEYGELIFNSQQIELTWVYSGSGTIWTVDLSTEFLIVTDVLPDVEETVLTFYRVRLEGLVIYSGAFMNNPEIDSDGVANVEFNYYPYNTNAEYDPTKQYQFVNVAYEKFMIIHYRSSDTDIATKSINFYDLSTGIVDYSLSLTDIMEAQLTYDAGAIEPDIDNINTRNNFIVLPLYDEIIEPLRVDIAGVNEEYEDLISGFNYGAYGIYIGQEAPIVPDYVADAVWIFNGGFDKNLFDFTFDAEVVKTDSDNSMLMNFIQSASFNSDFSYTHQEITDLYVTNDLILESTEFHNFISILGDLDLDIYSGTFSLDYAVNNDYPIGAVDTVTWIIQPTNMEGLGVASSAYTIFVSDSYEYGESYDIAGSINSGFSFFGLKDEVGFMFLISFFVIMATILLAYTKVTLPVYLITYIAIVGVFSVLGVVEIWFTLTFGSILVLGLIMSVRSGNYE